MNLDRPRRIPRRALVAGWFSFAEMGATAGDLMAADVVSDWLSRAGYPHDRAVAPPFTGGVDLDTIDPGEYTDVVFVCGPIGNGWPIDALFQRFAHARLAAVDVTMLQSLDEWNPFKLLLERDSSRTARPDLAFLAEVPSVPVVGVVLVHPQKEYGDRGQHAFVRTVVDQVLARRDFARIDLDTRLDLPNPVGNSPAAIESAIGRMDSVVTTRLHGMVLALRRGVAPVVIDPISGGGKVRRQAELLEWPVLGADELTEAALDAAIEWSLTPGARSRAVEASEGARRLLAASRGEFSRFLAPDGPI